MPCLLIFDGDVSARAIRNLQLSGENSLILFPLTSRTNIQEEIISRCQAAGVKDVKCLETGRIIDETADEIRDKYIEFIAGLPGKISKNGKNLKEWLYYPDDGVSLWWLSLVAEKNTLKNDTFHRLVQFSAIIRTIDKQKAGKIVLNCSSNKLISTLKLYCRQKALSFVSLSRGKSRGIKRLMDGYPATRAFLGAFSYLGNMVMDRIRFGFFISPGIERRIPADLKNSLLFVTYYPNIDTGAAAGGVFKNRYYWPLQENLEKQGRDIIWMALSSQNAGVSSRESIHYAQKFIENGYHFIFVDEFLAFTSYLTLFFRLLRLVIRFKRIEKELPAHHQFGDNISVYPLFREDWYSSFYGAIGAQGLLYLEAFKNMFKKLPDVPKGLYCCEMHALEKALIAARNRQAAETQLIGYQHATVSRMLLNYFNHPAELRENTIYALPKPDIVACNGEIPRSYFRESGWREDELEIVEAIRYDHLKESLQHRREAKGRVILVAFSIGIEESAAILNMVYEGLRDAPDIQVWLKPHPFLKTDMFMQKSGISLVDSRFEIKGGRIEELLPDAKGVIVSESGVALEALAYGCKIITVNLPDMVNMSPLRGVRSNLVRCVDSPAQLKQAVNDIMRWSGEDNSEEVANLIRRFFFFNEKSARPEKFLKLLS